MGSYQPPRDLDLDALLDDARDTAIEPCLDALRAMGAPFTGLLYAGVILTTDGLRVFEYNARFGDPEAQALLPLVGEDLVDLFTACADGTLAPGRVALRPGASVTVVAAAEGYPGTPRPGGRIAGLDRVDPGVQCFHAGTRLDGDGVVATGGRVLSITAQGADVDGARARAYDTINEITFDGMWYRRDIAAKQPMEVRS
jgi:phosphoribosylamine--glycine ligase